MKQQDKTFRMVVAAVTLISAVCLIFGSPERSMTAFFVPMLAFLETGRFPAWTLRQLPPEQTQIPEQAPTGAVLTEADAELVEMLYRCDYRPQILPLLLKPLAWDLTDGEPAVLIVHTHATECYSDTTAPQHDPYRTLDDGQNMVAMGRELKALLEAGGIEVIHDTTHHDYPDYNSAYANTRQTIAQWLTKYPSIRMVLDLHRDASDSTAGQLVTSATVGGQRSAQLLVMTGTDAGGSLHPNWEENLSVGLKLAALLEGENPGICRPVTLRSERFNTDMTPASLIIEVGAAGNTASEARLAIHALAQGVLKLAKGVNNS